MTRPLSPDAGYDPDFCTRLNAYRARYPYGLTTHTVPPIGSVRLFEERVKALRADPGWEAATGCALHPHTGRRELLDGRLHFFPFWQGSREILPAVRHPDPECTDAVAPPVCWQWKICLCDGAYYGPSMWSVESWLGEGSAFPVRHLGLHTSAQGGDVTRMVWDAQDALRERARVLASLFHSPDFTGITLKTTP